MEIEIVLGDLVEVLFFFGLVLVYLDLLVEIPVFLFELLDMVVEVLDYFLGLLFVLFSYFVELGV